MRAPATAIPQPPPKPGTPAPVVSICCITYNHERFIAQALDGFLMQQTDFPVEIIIHDDASTDGTATIIRDYIARFPGRIRAVLRTENQYKQGNGIIPMFAAWVRGEYIAICEGDDFWTAPEKLQSQVAYLRANPDCVACCHDTILVDEEGLTTAPSYFQSAQEKFTQADVIGSLLSREPTCSLVFRRSAFLEPLPLWYRRRANDLLHDILLTCHGSLGFINRNWAAYRIHGSGIWSGCRESTRIVELIVRYRLLLEEPYFEEHYRELLLHKIGEFGAQLFTRADAQHEIARLDEIVRAQSGALESTQRERERLAAREQALEEQLAQARSETQKHIDSLKAQLDSTVARYEQSIAELRPQVEQSVQRYEALITPLREQLDQLAATSQEQIALIAVLEQERDRLAAEAIAARNEAARATAAGQQHIDSLKAQLDRTAAENEKTIAALRPQLAETVQRYEAYLAPLKQQLDQLAATSKQQTQHIAVLEKERDRLAAEATAARNEAARATTAGQQHIDSLKAQLDRTVAENEKTIAALRPQLAETVQRYEAYLTPLKQQLEQLAATSKQQTRHIAILETERDRLAARETQLIEESAHYQKVMDEQLGYIKILEAARNQTAST